MRIGLNFFSIRPESKGGTMTYSLGILKGMLNSNKGHTFYVFVRKTARKFVAELVENNPNFYVIVISENFVGRIARFLLPYVGSTTIYNLVLSKIYSEFGDLVNKQLDLFYTPTTVLFPLQYEIPTVVTLHDLQHIHFPENFTMTTRLKRFVTYGNTIKNASYLHCSSEFIKKDLIDSLKIPENRIIVSLPGIDLDAFNKISIQSGSINLPKPYFFYPAQVWRHKNHITILKALKILRQRGQKINFVMTGKENNLLIELKKFIQDNDLWECFFHVGNVSYSELIRIYLDSAFVVSAAIYEASSFPVLEAAALEKPIFASEIPSNVELSKKLSINLFPTNNEDILADKIELFLNNQESSSEQTSVNLSSIKEFDWHNVCLDLLNQFDRIICDNSRNETINY